MTTEFNQITRKQPPRLFPLPELRGDGRRHTTPRALQRSKEARPMLAMEYYLENGEIPDFEEIGARYPLADLEDLRICFFMGRKIWDEEIAPLGGR
jgi:hypothetical protein